MLWLNSFAADSDYRTTVVMFTFIPSDEDPQPLCTSIPIIDDSVANEPVEEFSMTLVSAVPAGVFIQDTSCISIVDNDGK